MVRMIGCEAAREAVEKIHSRKLTITLFEESGMQLYVYPLFSYQLFKNILKVMYFIGFCQFFIKAIV
jgi:hypothetical protein